MKSASQSSTTFSSEMIKEPLSISKWLHERQINLFIIEVAPRNESSEIDKCPGRTAVMCWTLGEDLWWMAPRVGSSRSHLCVLAPAVSSSSPPFGWTIILLPSSLHFFSFSAAGGHNVLSIELFIIQQTVLLSLYGNEGKEGEMRDNKPKKKEKKTFTTRENDSSWLLIGVGSVPSVKRKKWLDASWMPFRVAHNTKTFWKRRWQ